LRFLRRKRFKLRPRKRILTAGCVHRQRVEGPEAEDGDPTAEEEEGARDLHRPHAGLRRKAQRRKSQGIFLFGQGSVREREGAAAKQWCFVGIGSGDRLFREMVVLSTGIQYG